MIVFNSSVGYGDPEIVSNPPDDISFRPMIASDIGQVPIGCQGDPDVVRDRIADLGASAILAFDGVQHVGQLQFRRYQPGLNSPRGMWGSLYWGDFAERAPELPAETLSLFCYHVGQLDDSDQRDARYQGRGIGFRLLDYCLEWAEQAGFAAVVAKATPSARPIMAFMGGQPAEGYQERGFQISASWVDSQLQSVVTEKDLVPEGMAPAEAARVSCCVRQI